MDPKLLKKKKIRLRAEIENGHSRIVELRGELQTLSTNVENMEAELEDLCETLLEKASIPYIRVNYGINKKEGRKTVHRCGKMRIKGVWDDETTQTKIKIIIHRRHPGWNITGWCMWNIGEKKVTEVRN